MKEALHLWELLVRAWLGKPPARVTPSPAPGHPGRYLRPQEGAGGGGLGELMGLQLCAGGLFPVDDSVRVSQQCSSAPERPREKDESGFFSYFNST